MRKRVVWDETNLADNEEYRRLHPVTMRIDEPKTPFVHEDGSSHALLEEHCEESHTAPEGKPSSSTLESSGTFEEALEKQDAEEEGNCPGSTWDPQVNAIAHHARVSAPHCHATSSSSQSAGSNSTESTSQPTTTAGSSNNKRARPVAISTDAVDEADVEKREQEQAEATFKRMRKAVYADEGAKFRSLLGQAVADDEEEDLKPPTE